jgi:hypothetical protein
MPRISLVYHRVHVRKPQGASDISPAKFDRRVIQGCDFDAAPCRISGSDLRMAPPCRQTACKGGAVRSVLLCVSDRNRAGAPPDLVKLIHTTPSYTSATP